MKQAMTVRDRESEFGYNEEIYLQDLHKKQMQLNTLRDQLMLVDSSYNYDSLTTSQPYSRSKFSVTGEYITKDIHYDLRKTLYRSICPEKVYDKITNDEELMKTQDDLDKITFSVGFAQSCNTLKALDLPIITKLISNEKLVLKNYRLNENLAKALADNIQILDDKVSGVTVVNSIHDSKTLEYILMAVKNNQNITALSLKDIATEYISDKAVDYLKELLGGTTDGSDHPIQINQLTLHN